MGLCLTLLVLKEPRQLTKTSVLCLERVNLDQDYAILGQLAQCRGHLKPTIQANPIPPQMWVETYEEEGVRRTRTDNYGTELTFVYAQQLKRLKMPGDASPKNKAVKAFVDALPNETPIILWWC